jgi:hypothetical protein
MSLPFYQGTVAARSSSVAGPMSTQTYTIDIHMSSDNVVRLTGCQPWNWQWPDAVHARPYPLSTLVVCFMLGDKWRFMFPAPTPNLKDCAGNVIGGVV